MKLTLALLFAASTATATPEQAAAGAWFDTFDSDKDGRWSVVEVGALTASLATKRDLTGMHTDKDVSLRLRAAREFLLSFGGTLSLSRQDFIESWPQIDPSRAQQIRVSLPKPGLAAVTWVGSLSASSNPCVLYCQLNDNNVCNDAMKVVDAVSWNYSVPSRWWDKQGLGHASLHGAVFSIGASTHFQYAVGNTTTGSCTAASEFFNVAPAPTAKDTATRFAVVGDHGSYQLFGFKVAELMQATLPEYDPSAMFIIGDVSYAGIATNFKFLNITSDDEFEPFWNVYGVMMQNMSARYPFYCSHGNHDAFYDSMAYKARWTSGALLSSVPPPMKVDTPKYYGLDVGNIHFTVMDSEAPYDASSDMYRVLEADMRAAFAAKNNGTGPQWLVFINHRPLISSDNNELNDHLPNSSRYLTYQQLLLKYQYDLVLVGHQHGYERVHPNINGTVVSVPKMVNSELTYQLPQAPVHVLIGTGGAVEEETWMKPQPEWSAYRGSGLFDSYGYGQVTACNNTHLKIQFIPVTPSKLHKADVFWIARKM